MSPIEAQDYLKGFINDDTIARKALAIVIEEQTRLTNKLIKSQVELSRLHNIIVENKIPAFEKIRIEKDKLIRYWEDYSIYLHEIQSRLFEVVSDNIKAEVLKDLYPPTPECFYDDRTACK